MLAVYASLFTAPIAVGASIGGWRWVCERRQLARAFARGRAEGITRLPTLSVVAIAKEAA